MITSTSNQRIREVVQLQKKSRLRNQQGVFVVEGIRMLREIPADRIEKLYMTEDFYKKYKSEVFVSGLSKEKKELVTGQVFSYISDTRTPQGGLAIVRQKHFAAEQMWSREDAHLLLLDNLQDPGNLGTIFRTAEAAGVTGVVMSRDCVDLYNPKVIRSTMGAIFRLPFVYTDSLPDTVRELQKNGVKVYAAHLEGKSDYDQEDYRGKTAFLIGNEGNGLREEVAACADTWIRIPMEGQAESLNAAVAAAVLMFETSRQRRQQG